MESKLNPAESKPRQKSLIFVTGNASKFAEAEKVAKQYGVVLEAKALEIAEIQSSDPAAVTRAKAESAYRMLKHPVVVHDSSWSIPGLKGFPGAYMHDMVRWLRTEDWLNLMRGCPKRAVEVCENVAYYDGCEMKMFQYRQQGIFVDSPRGENGNSLEKVVVLADNRTIAEHHDTGIQNNSVMLKVWEDFFGWYRERKDTMSRFDLAKVRLEKVSENSRQTLWNLLQYMLFETSPSGENIANEDGSFDYRYFDSYFTDSDREAYLIKSETGELMGFVMINQYLQKVHNGHAIAEFLVLPRFRRSGIGREVAKRCFAMHPGDWEVGPADGSESAYYFWKSVIDEATGEDNQLEDELFVFNVKGGWDVR